MKRKFQSKIHFADWPSVFGSKTLCGLEVGAGYKVIKTGSDEVTCGNCDRITYIQGQKMMEALLKARDKQKEERIKPKLRSAPLEYWNYTYYLD